MYAQMLKGKYLASESTLNELIDTLPVDVYESEEKDLFDMRVVDPPVINGVTLREHPNKVQRMKFNRILDGGGVICGIYNADNKIIQIVTHKENGAIGRSLDDFIEEKNALIKVKVAARIGKGLDTNFEHHGVRGQKKRLKNMKPEDFWTLFSALEYNVITNSEVPDIVEAVQDINDMNNVNLSTGKMKSHISLFYVNKFLSRNTFDTLKGE